MSIEKTLHDLLSPVVERMGCELVGCEYCSQNSILRVYVDKPDGVTLDDCAKVSRQLNAMLDVENIIQRRYFLEVSSPGLARPLFTIEQFERFVGKQVDVKLSELVKNRRHIVGEIVAIIDNDVVLKADNKSMNIPYSKISKAHLLPDVKF